MKAVPQPMFSIPPYVPCFHKVTGLYKNSKLCTLLFIVKHIKNKKEGRFEARREGKRRNGRKEV